MVETSITDEIMRLRDRLKNIEEERTTLAEDDFAARTDLLDEEHEIQARLAELTEKASSDDLQQSAASQAARGTDLTRTPELPSN